MGHVLFGIFLRSVVECWDILVSPLSGHKSWCKHEFTLVRYDEKWRNVGSFQSTVFWGKNWLVMQGEVELGVVHFNYLVEVGFGAFVVFGTF